MIDKEWDAPGERWITFVGASKAQIVTVKEIIRDYLGHPLIILAENGTIYNWNSVVSMTHIKESNG
ncbi:MAG: hypothetical protein ABWY25_06060 [Paenisporosarcina sp.]